MDEDRWVETMPVSELIAEIESLSRIKPHIMTDLPSGRTRATAYPLDRHQGNVVRDGPTLERALRDVLVHLRLLPLPPGIATPS